MLQSNNGGKFVSKVFNHFFNDHDIEKQMSTQYMPQQNEIAERTNRTIVEMAWNMLHAQNLDKSFWTETTTNGVYI